jgi:LysM repeat protein
MIHSAYWLLIQGWLPSGYNFKYMKEKWLYGLFALAFSACSLTGAPAADKVVLTPYVPESREAETAVPAALPTAVNTPAPSPTPTPLIHTVALGETFSSIALRYGLSINDVQAANPDADPNALIVGDELLIPAGGSTPQAGIALESLPLEISEPDCSETIEGNWWCVVMVRNPLEEPAADISVRFSMLDAAGEIQTEMNIPTVLNRLAPGESLPAAVLFDADGDTVPIIQAEIASALPLVQTAYTFLPVEISGEQIEIDGRFAVVSASVAVTAPEGEGVQIWVLASAYDEKGRLVGIRRIVSEVQAASGGAVNIHINLYSVNMVIVDVRLSAEVFQIN